MKKEYWKPVVGYDGLYEVSNFGRVKSLPRNGTINKEKILKQFVVKDYLCVNLRNKKIKQFKVHRLVAQAFLDNPLNLPQVNHKDEVKTNNHVDNLEWCDAKYNNCYGTRTKRSAENNLRKYINTHLMVNL